MVICATCLGARSGRSEMVNEQPLLVSDGTLTLDSVGFQVSVESLYAGTWLQPAD